MNQETPEQIAERALCGIGMGHTESTYFIRQVAKAIQAERERAERELQAVIQLQSSAKVSASLDMDERNELVRLREELAEAEKIIPSFMVGWFEAEKLSQKSDAARDWFQSMPGEWPFNTGVKWPANISDYRRAAQWLERRRAKS